MVEHNKKVKKEEKKEQPDKTISAVQYKNVFILSEDKQPETTTKSDLIAEITSIGGLFATILGGSIVSLIVFPLVASFRGAIDRIL